MRRSIYLRPGLLALLLGAWLVLPGLTLAQNPMNLGRVQYPNPNFMPGYPSNYLSNPGYYLGTTRIYSAMTNPIYRVPMSAPTYAVTPSYSYYNAPSYYNSGYSNPVYPTAPSYSGATGGVYNSYSGYNSYTPTYAAPSSYYSPQFFR